MGKGTEHRLAGSLLLDRLNALSDGVIAIVLTLLVLGIDVPDDHSFAEDGLWEFLARVEFHVVVYAVSFALVATYWMIQHVLFHYVKRGSRNFAWLNLFFLFTLTLIPFTTKLTAMYRLEPLVIVIFSANNLAANLTLALTWRYAWRAGLTWPGTDPMVVHQLMKRILAGAALSVLASMAAFVNVRISHVVFLFIPVLHFSHRVMDRHWFEVAKASRTSGPVDALDE